MAALAAGSECSVLWGGMLILKRQNPGYIWVTSGSLVVGACACCGRWCDGTKILKSDLRLLLSAGTAFRTNSGRGRAQPMPDTQKGTAGGGGAGGSASVSAAERR